MASNTQTTEYKRRLRKARMGKERRRALRNNGTTPVFPVHTPESDANAPDQARKSED